jgi:N-formylglutamate amidohydrolase
MNSSVLPIPVVTAPPQARKSEAPDPIIRFSAGWKIPAEAKDICLLTKQDILADGDTGAAEIYNPLKKAVNAYVTSDIARAIVDLNRAENDFWKDGVIKTHTCWDVPIYKTYPSQDTIAKLIAKYHRPYRAMLSDVAKNVKIGIDCHTMAAIAPPVALDRGRERPPFCLSNADSACPREWIETLAQHLTQALGFRVSINQPFKGGYIIRSHANEIPWIQIKFSRAPFLSNSQKSRRLLDALNKWVAEVFWQELFFFFFVEGEPFVNPSIPPGSTFPPDII